MNETLKTIATRTSTRSYQNKQINEEDLNFILQAAIEAPTAMNRQLCEAFALYDSNKVDTLCKTVTTTLRSLGQDRPENYHCAYHAPTLIIVTGPKDYSRRIEDGSCMLQNIFLAAQSLGLGSCWINQLRDIQDEKPIRDLLTSYGIPKDHHVVGCAAIGYIDQPTPYRKKKKERIHIIK